MTEKRFTSQRTEDYNFSDILDNGKWIGICHIDCEDDFVNKFNELAEENEQLRKENMEYYHLINCGNCKYHNYDWFDDGDEFEVCEKGHTERLMYNQFCKEWEEL